MNKELWIFGDSYAQAHPYCEYAYTELLKKDYNVINFAQGGSSVDWSIEQFLQAIKTKDTKNVYVLFCLTSVYRQYWNFFETEEHHYLATHLGGGTTWRNILTTNVGSYIAKYKEHRRFAKSFWNSIHPEWKEINEQKNVAIINMYAQLFKKVLIWPCFEEVNVDIKLDKRVTLKTKPLVEIHKILESPTQDPRPNHMDEKGHKKMYKNLVEWIDEDV